MRAHAILVAAGSGRRLGGSLPKQLQLLGGRPLLAWPLAALDACGAIVEVVLVVAADQLERASAIVAAVAPHKPCRLCVGGSSRTDSVRAGLAALPADAELVAIHDAARPLVTPELIARVIEAAERSGAAFPALAVPDTLHRTRDGLAVAALEREALVLAQTPQVFRASRLRDALAAQAEGQGWTDEVQLLQLRGEPVQVVAGEPRNFKVTFAADLALAEALVSGPGGEPRVGTGYDVHRLVPGRPLVLGGVELPAERGLLGHSDADVLAHAIGDALLGAAALGDLGAHFPPDDPSLEGISSLELLRRIARLLAGAALRIGNLDSVVICERPRLAPHIPAMRASLAGALGVEPARVAVKATTNEQLGFAGREEGIAALATALLLPRR
jgi:2-C-methyl-D-erythritol 4-phosphate cytidylyltransferase/2-C-methyl-D-erythritol 2,4-cyclodiphosphate synthase